MMWPAGVSLAIALLLLALLSGCAPRHEMHPLVHAQEDGGGGHHDHGGVNVLCLLVKDCGPQVKWEGVPNG